MNFGSAFNSCLSSSQPRIVMATAPKAMTASSSRAAVNAVGDRMRRTEILTMPSLSKIAPAASGRKMPVSTANPPASGTGCVVDFALAGIVHEVGAQAPFAPERQREQRRHKRARKGGEKKIEWKSHSAQAAFGGQFQIKIVMVVHHFFDGEIFADKVLAALAKFFPQRGITGELQQAFCAAVSSRRC